VHQPTTAAEPCAIRDRTRFSRIAVPSDAPMIPAAFRESPGGTPGVEEFGTRRSDAGCGRYDRVARASRVQETA
jgi:hypothetical protein